MLFRCGGRDTREEAMNKVDDFGAYWVRRDSGWLKVQSERTTVCFFLILVRSRLGEGAAPASDRRVKRDDDEMNVHGAGCLYHGVIR